ncbi:MAG: glycine cleavage system protein H [Rhodocyclales bacterium]|nr:glycine cleavage system protein H [Rhodocyclales bacterium]
MGPAPFRGAIPDDLLYDPEYDMWVRREGAEAVVGATAYGIFRAGEIIGFTAKPKGAEVERGRGLGTVECAKTVLAVRAPISLLLVEANEYAEEHPAMLNRDPYRDGWMVRARPTAWEAEHGGLLDAAAYREHVARIEPGAVIE